MNTDGLLYNAHFTSHADPITWCEIEWNGLRVTVADDAMKAACGDRPSIRLPVTYAESVAILRHLRCIAPTKALADAMYTQAKAKLRAVALVQTAADSKRMRSVEFSLRFHDAVEEQLRGKPAGLRAGAWKYWILHPRLAEMGAVNYGFWTANGKVIQTVGARHDAAHSDYSQLLQPIQRFARTKEGECVDLLDVLARAEPIPKRFLDAFRQE